MTTPKLQMPELAVGQAGKELTHNQALAVLDQLAQAVVVDKDLTAPPGSPANGSMYIVAAGATGAWAGQAGKLAYWLTTVAAWTFITPADGWSVWVTDEAKRYALISGSWSVDSAGPNSAALDGLTGAADKLPYFTGAGALALADYTAVARTFDAAATVATQRAALGLGTAATATLTTSNADPTSGRVVKNGDYGLFRYSNGIVAGSSAKSYNIPGSRTYIQGNTTTDLPVAETGWIIVDATGDHTGGERLTQTYISIISGRRWIRSENAGLFTAWSEFWTSTTANLIVVDTASFGCGTGSGATAVQPTSKSTGVPLNKPSGQITMASDAIAANTAVSFTLTNNKIAANDIPEVVIKSGATAGAYVVQVDAVAAGSCRISIRNMTAGSLSETLVLQFNIEKGATA